MIFAKPQPDSNYPALGDLPLSRTEVDRGCERRTDEGWLPSLLVAPGTRILILVAGRAHVHDGTLVFVDAADVPDGALYVYLGSAGGTEMVLAAFHEAPAGLATSVQWLGLRDVAAGLSARDAGLFVEAVAIANWHTGHKHCPRCGAALEVVQSGWVRRCPADGSLHFPRTDPAIIVAITDESDRLLLGANAQWGGKRYSTLAGFVEPGESLEAAVIREVAEESGVAVTDPRYMGSQPWPFPCSLMLGFTARATSTDLVPDGEEIIDLRWFTREELAEEVRTGQIGVPMGVSISSALIENWYGGTLPEPETLEN
ncbi:NAD(+) diphosphatase [Paeniglutamicibacter cryotolerans]|uniref:NAD(+) diphosphatase n=1 Tax=Paeniglutamicibacter cryotolerans TaxID=670079 RepID=A0A839QX46_9MICC|nr:NAD(+) diphosphatase [Paeniglutamicibacter cryotolerans]MBB2996561.1 NAD+ diphosphatase [Paeniglutamicibacter cryotolerans]